jgi:hypothetical protein
VDAYSITYRYRIGNIVTSIHIDLDKLGAPDLDAYPVSYTVSYDIADRGPADAHTKRHANNQPTTNGNIGRGDTVVDRHANGD